ncbi:hypothetical protein MUK42_14411 [Musa troglodytarum]|uniref:Jacalin-type lectin domain-containing protein n=1 Tax=Musa troglodytarum TaxID=320322 RepID=A0A9E7IFT8_9LILI|nr:hypothetical protein MUK42_14411 [Musa troglodytarum]
MRSHHQRMGLLLSRPGGRASPEKGRRFHLQAIDVYSTSQLVCETPSHQETQGCHYKYSRTVPRRRACNRNTSSWKGVLPYRCLQMGKVVKEGPWGGNAGKQFDTGSVDRFINVKIYHGDAIYGLELTCIKDGRIETILIGEKKGRIRRDYPQ